MEFFPFFNRPTVFPSTFHDQLEIFPHFSVMDSRISNHFRRLPGTWPSTTPDARFVRSFPDYRLRVDSRPTVDAVSTDRGAIRGREQQLIDFNGGAQSVGGTARNMINGVADFNPNRIYYIYQSIREFGALSDNSPPRNRLGPVTSP